MLKEHTLAPDFKLPDQNGKIHKLSDYLGKYVLVYFYPKDDTPGCTKEACTLRDDFHHFGKSNITILGISHDTSESHEKFIKKYHLPFTLLSDSKKDVIKKYEANGLFAQRISYLIAPDGMIVKAYSKVVPEKHASEVLEDRKKMK